MENITTKYVTLSCIIITLMSIAFVGLSLLCSIEIKNFNVFASSGAVVAIAGIYLSFSHTLLLKEENDNKLMCNKLEYALIMPDPGTDLYFKRLNQARRILISERVGFVLSIIGTLIWAYGGYLPT